MDTKNHSKGAGVSRRAFLHVSAASAGVFSLGAVCGFGAFAQGATPGRAKRALVKAAFVYPPTETLRQAGYYSWPGSTFDAEARHAELTGRIAEINGALGMQIDAATKAIDSEEDAKRFADEAKDADGLLLILFKKGHWPRVKQIAEATQLPTVIYAPLGVLLVDLINEARRMPGAHLINTEPFDAVESGLRMLRAGAWMRQSRIMNIDGAVEKQETVPHLGTEIRTIPHERFYAEFARTAADERVTRLASAYLNGAQGKVEPTEADITESAKCYFALKRLVEAEQADALMMNCLPGLQRPHKHVPPCMAFMSLRDEGVPAGCQSDLNATLTLLLVQYLFDRPGFQQNASMDTGRNLYFGAHCTSPSKMNGPDAPPEPYILRNHAEAGWGCVPRVLFTPGQTVTMAQYVTGDTPQMYIYTGAIVSCPDSPLVGGCRTNVEMTINEVADVRDVKGMHQIVFYGAHGGELRNFCKLYKVEAVA